MRSFHVVTIVNRWPAYDAMRASMAAVGFDEAACRFSPLDNAAANVHDPFRVLEALSAPDGGAEPYVILCHQDLRFGPASSAGVLLERLRQLDVADPTWAAAGTAGGDLTGHLVRHLDDPTGSYRWPGLPHRVVTLDENFLAFGRGRVACPTPGLSGFHLYGADLGLTALRAGRACYVIDFPLHHLSAGDPGGEAFRAAEAELSRAWRSRLLWGVVKTTCAEVVVGINPAVERVIASAPVRRLLFRRGWSVRPMPRWLVEVP